MTRLLVDLPVEFSWARPLGRARELAAAQAEVGLANSGLLELLLPRRGRGVQVAAACATLETLAVEQPALAGALCISLAACAPLALAEPARRRNALLARAVSGEHLAPVLATPAPSGWGAAPREPGWQFRGEAELLVPGGTADSMVAFAHVAGARGRRLHGFLVSTAGLSLPASAGPHALRLDAHVEAEVLMQGPEAQAALTQALALRRLLATALGLGLCRSAFDYAQQVAAQGGSDAAGRLAAASASLRAAQLMLRDTARAADKGGDCAVPSAMALVAAWECVERVIASATQIAGGNPDADPAYLQRLLAARRFHESLAGPAQAQRVLLSEALVPASRPHHRKEPSLPMSRSSNPRAPEAPDRVGEILDAAADAFTQQSYDATSLDYIGDVIGVTKGSIYYHYRSKADLFMAVYRRAMEMNIETVEPIAGRPGARAIDRLYRMAHAHALQVMKHLSYQRVAVQGLEAHLMGRVTDEQRERLKEVIALRDRYEDLFVGAIEEAITAGDLPRQSARLAVKPLFGAINWTTMWYQRREGETAADRERIATQLATFVVSGLTQSHQPAAVPGDTA